MRDTVEFYFDNAIRNKFQNQEIQNFILRHERKGKVIENLCEQCKIAEMKKSKPNSPYKFTLPELRAFADTTAMMFASACITHKEQQLLSDAERSRLRAEFEHEKDTELAVQDIMKEVDDDRLVSRPGSVAK